MLEPALDLYKVLLTGLNTTAAHALFSVATKITLVLNKGMGLVAAVLT